MKKLLMFLTILFSSFILFTNVKAETISTNFGNIDFDFDTFKVQNNLTDYNYYVISLRANETTPMLTLFKNKPTMSALGYNITFNSDATDVVIYMYNNNSWSLFGTYNYCNSKNIIYSTNIDFINYSGSTISLVKNDLYYSYIKSYENELNLTFSHYAFGTVNLTYDHENNAFIFDNSNNAYDKTLNITKNYWYFMYDGNFNLYFVQSDTPLYLVDFTSSRQQLCSGTSATDCHDGVDAFLYQIGSGGITNSWTNSYYMDFTKFTNSFSETFMWVNANQRFYHNGNVLNSSGNVISEKNFIDGSSIVVNKVTDLGDNSFGFYQNYITLNLTSLSGAVDNLSVVCEDRPFNNNYCSINYSDLINHNSDISVFNNYGASFTQNFGLINGLLSNDRYYLYSFRIQKPFVPQVGNLFINASTNNSYQVEPLGVYLQDGGSYTDYIVKFKISNSDYNVNTPLEDITVVFRDGLSNYYGTIPISFNYSVYRSFKLQYFSSDPTMEQVNDFYNNRDLSSIDGLNSNNSFFTDNDFNTYGFGGIVTAPFRFLYAIENYQTCSDIVLPFPHSNNTITLKCVRNTIPSSINPLITILQVILSGFICYRIAVETLSVIKDISSPEDANIEVVDL